MSVFLTTWPPRNNAISAHHSHLVITFGAPLSDKMRATGIQQLNQRIDGIKGWRFYITSDSDSI